MTENATPKYIQVDLDQLRVGMRFDYRLDQERDDRIERKLTGLHPIAYDYTTQFGQGHATLTDLDTKGRTFWVHPDDLHVDEPANASGWETTNEIVARTHDAAYEKGVRDGYLKAQQEQGAKPTAGGKRRDIRREDAVLWAVQALGGTPEAAHLLIPLAQQIERYVNGNDQQADRILPVGTRVEVDNGMRKFTGTIDEIDPDMYHVKSDDSYGTTYYPATAVRVIEGGAS